MPNRQKLDSDSASAEARVAAFGLRLEILKKELDFIDGAIRKIDDIGSGVKNWAILTWSGSVAALLSKLELHQYAAWTAIPPLVFWLADAHWRKIQRRFLFRQGQISDFLNGPGLERSFLTGKLEIDVLDPIARRTKSAQLLRFISLRRTLSFATVSLIYLGLSALSLLLAFVLR